VSLVSAPSAVAELRAASTLALGTPARTLATLLRSWYQLRAEQWLPAAELAELRTARLRRVIAHAQRARYYASAFRAAGLADPGAFQPQDLGMLPFLDRQLIAARGLEEFLTVGRSGLFSVVTSGSTGTPGRFLRSREEEAEYSARWWRVYAAYGCGWRDAQVNVATANKPDRAGPIAVLRRGGILPRVERLASDAPPAEVLAEVRRISPPILTGYAGAIEALAAHVLATGAQVRSPRAVFCTAMEVTDRCLRLAEQAFGAPAVDVYVSNEFGVIAWSCPVRRDLLHLNDDAFLVEIVGTDGAPVSPGAPGELVVTSLGLRSMPLIRYRTGDIAASIPGPCECGRGLGLMTRVHGRTAHAIRRPDGGLITTPVVTRLLARAAAYEWVQRFQVREDEGRRLRLLIEARRSPSESQREGLRQTLEEGLGRHFGVTVEVVDEIPEAPNGKLQYLVPLVPR
jgi:phenylacetate-CoA ligase